MRYVGPHRKLIFLAMLFMLLSTGVELLLPYITKQGIDKYLAKLYQVYTDTPEACDMVMGLEPAEGDFIRLTPDSVFLRKASLDEVDPAVVHELESQGNLTRETFYLFPRRGSMIRPDGQAVTTG